MERSFVIQFSSDNHHIKNFFLEMIGSAEEMADCFTIEESPNLVVIDILKSTALSAARKSTQLEELYHHARVEKSEHHHENEKFVTLRIPKNHEFDPLVQALSPLSKTVEIKPGYIAISGSSDDLKDLLTKDDHQTYQLSTMLDHSNAKTTEIITTSQLMIGKRVSAKNFPHPSVFVSYIQSGNYENPPLTPGEFLTLSNRIRIAAFGTSAVAALAVLGYVGSMALKYGSAILDGEKRFGPALRNYEEANDPLLFTEREKAREKENAKKAAETSR